MNMLNQLVILQDVESTLTAQDLTPSEETARQLVHMARYFLEHAKTLDAAKEVRDTLQRIQIQYQQRGATLAATNTLAAGRIVCEWHIGKDLAELPRSNGGRGNVSHGGNSFLETLAAARIPQSTAYRFMKLAEVDAQDLDLYFNEIQERGDEISLNGVLNYFTSHVTIDPRADADADDIPETPDMNEDELPQVRVVTIVCRHCGAKDLYEVG